MKIIHANSSLPRSGSELLQALLAQHPQVYASPTSPLLEYFYGAMANTAMAEVKAQDPALMKQAFTAFMREGARGYYEAITDKPVVVDKSRGWLQHAEMLWDCYPQARIICMTRKLEDIIASLERIYQQHNGHPETRHLPRSRQARAEYWQRPGTAPLGIALERIRDRQASGEDQRILYVDYDALIERPVAVMRRVFGHLGLEPVDIDPNHVRKAAPEDDAPFGIFGRHQLRRVVGYRKD